MPGTTFTIVTPCLNAAATIGQALESVRSQGRDDVEHIVIDGGSTDGTQEIVERYPAVVLVSEPDEGLSDAVNKGFALAGGELVGWLNADDWYLPGAFDAVADAAGANPEAEWITGRCPIVDGSGARQRSLVTSYKNALLARYSFPLYLTQNFVSCPSTFIRRVALEAVGTLSLDYRYSMDYDLFLRLARRGDPVILERDLAVFTMVPGTLSMENFEDQFREHAIQARIHGEGHPVAVAANLGVSLGIVFAYRVLAALGGR